MKKILVTALAAVMGVTGLGIGATTASAAPVIPMLQVTAASDVIQVQGDGRWSRRDENYFGQRRIIRRNWNNGPRVSPRSGFYVQGGQGWYNGHRGYRNYRQGYRRHGDWWFPAGAFIAGAIIGGALADPGPTYYEPQQPVRRVYRNNYSNAHVQWCYDRYRSYDAYSNTFQPYNGPRQQCYSPYS